MRFKSTLAVIGVALALSLTGPTVSEAGGGWRSSPGYWAYDPYAYRYIPPRAYPYYNSGYWRPGWEMRRRPRVYHVRPPYYPAWGYPVGGCYKACKKRRRAYHRGRYIK